MVTLAVVAVAAATAFAAAQASAALPEVGRCVAKPGGKYKYSGCVITASAGTGKFEFEAGAGPKPKFEALVNVPKMETAGGKKVSCSSGLVSGEWTGANTASVILEFQGCGNAKAGGGAVSCSTSPTGGSIKTEMALEGVLGFIKGGGTLKPVVGLDLKPKSPSTELMTFFCGQPIVEPPASTWTVEGSVIGRITPVNSMRTEEKLTYAATLGKQAIEMFEGGAKDVLSAKIVNEKAEVSTEALGLTLKGVEHAFIPFVEEEAMEIKARTV
jgi:hypothetical protein